MTEFLLKKAIAVLRALDSEGGKHFIAAMSLWLSHLRKKMEKEKDPVEIYRYQGRIEVLDRIVNLRNEVVESQRK